MRAWLLAIISAISLCSVHPASTQDAEPAPADPAAARAEGDRIIVAAQANDLFENITGNDGDTRLRHKASGMICSFDPAAKGNYVRVYPTRAATPARGDDVGCGSSFLNASFTQYATRYRPMPSEAEDMADAVAAVRQTWSHVEPLRGEFGLASAGGRPAPLFVALKGRPPNGTEAATFVVLTHVDGWSFKTRASGPLEQAQLIAFTANIISVSSVPPLEQSGR